MADEIERKFLVRAGADHELPERGERLRQGYLAIDGPVEVRIRLSDREASLTIKAGTGLVRTEVERPLSVQDASELWTYTQGRQLEKVRHRMHLGGDVVAEVDSYEGALEGLCIVEVEFPTPEEAGAFQPPPWFGEELTGTAGWSNADLARYGRPR